MNPSRQTVLITGGGSGIGLALAEKFLAHGHRVLVTGRNREKLEAVKRKHPQLSVHQSDVTKTEDVVQLVSAIEREFGGLDVLVNNAGIMNLVDAGNEGNDLARQFEEIEINYHAPIRLLHHTLPLLKRSSLAVVVNVSSGLAYVPFAQAPVYSGTKSALHFWTQAIRPQLKAHNIRVVELLPPVVYTQLAADADLKDDNLKPMSPEKLACAFWNGYTRGKEEITPGISTALRIMGRVAPKFIFKQLNKQSVPSPR